MSKIKEALSIFMLIYPLIEKTMQMMEEEYAGQKGKGTEKKQAVIDTIAVLFSSDSLLWKYLKDLVSIAINVLSRKLFNSTGKDPEPVIELTEKVEGQ